MSKRPQSGDICPADNKKIKTTEAEKQDDVAENTKERGKENEVEETTTAVAESDGKEKTLPQETCDQLTSSQTLDYSSDTVPDSTLDPGETKYFSD